MTDKEKLDALHRILKSLQEEGFFENRLQGKTGTVWLIIDASGSISAEDSNTLALFLKEVRE